jgi:hypothetical protein
MAVELMLRHEGGGLFRVASRLDYETAVTALETNEMLRAVFTRRRSVRQNNLLHALIQAAFENQRGGPKLDTWEKLKAYLLIEAGHSEERRFSIGNVHPAQAALVCGGFAAVIRDRHEYMAAGIDQQRREVVMRFAKSVSFSKATSDEMKPVMDHVVATICTEIVPGMDPATILNMAKTRAGGSLT